MHASHDSIKSKVKEMTCLLNEIIDLTDENKNSFILLAKISEALSDYCIHMEVYSDGMKENVSNVEENMSPGGFRRGFSK